MKHHVLITLALLALTAVSVAAQDDNVLIGEAYVTNITVDDSGDEIIIAIEGELGDPCTEISEITQAVEGDTITITVVTSRNADDICAMVLEPFETDYTLDSSQLAAGDYTLNVGEESASITITATFTAETVDEEDLTCPETDNDNLLFDDFGTCFLYPDDYSEISGNGFVLISKPLTVDALLIILITDAEEVTLEDIQAVLEADDLDFDSETVNGQDILVINGEDTREAYTIANEQIYQFIVQPMDATGEALWDTIIESLVFPESVNDE